MSTNANKMKLSRKRPTFSLNIKTEATKNTASPCKQPSPKKKRTQPALDSPPIPTSFVPFGNRLQDLEREFFDSDSDDEPDKQAAPSTRKQSEKESLRKQLQAAKLRLTMGTKLSTTHESVLSQNSNASSSSTETEQSIVSDQKLLETTKACLEASDISKVSIEEIIERIREVLDVSAFSKHQTTLIQTTLQSLVRATKQQATSIEPQPTPHQLETTVDRVFQTILQTKGVENCTVKQFLVTTQAQFASQPFNKATRTAVKERVVYLLQQRQQQQSTSTSGASFENKETAEPSNTATKLTNKASTTAKSRSKKTTMGTASTVPTEKGTTTAIAKEVANASAVSKSTPSKQPTKKGRTAVSSTKQKTSDDETTISLAVDSSNAGDDFLDIGGEDDDVPTETTPLEPSPPQPIVKKPPPPPKPAPRRGTKRTKRSKPVQTTTTTTAKEAVGAPPPAKKKRTTAPKTRQAGCTLCSKCPCTFNLRNSVDSTEPTSFSKSNAEIEKALVKRLAKLEATADQYEEQTDMVRRRLKKHRREIWKRRQSILQRADDKIAKGKNKTNKPFLPDVDEFDRDYEASTNKKRASHQAVLDAQGVLFDKPATVQGTLTQLMDIEVVKQPAEREETADAVDPSIAANTTENTSDQLEVNATDSDEGAPVPTHDSETESVIEGESATPPVLRMESNRDTELAVQTTTSLWGALRNNNYESNWDQLFHEEDGDSSGMDHLLGLMGECTQAESVSNNDTEACSPSALSQRAQGLFRELTDRRNADSTAMEGMATECPHWRENVAFALAQTDRKEVSEALENVKAAQSRLQKLKEEFLAKMERQANVLGMFEEALMASSTRLETPVDDTATDENIAVEADAR